MARRGIEIGLLFSRSGVYAQIARAGPAGALRAIAAVTADPSSLDIERTPVDRDPQGNVGLYGPFCTEILRDTKARHVIGTATSWSRKEVIPVLERAGGTLWYPCPYEGHEASDRVVCTRACPNQHLLPLFDWVVQRHGAWASMVSYNIAWGWKMSRIAHDLIAEAGGNALSQRYLPLGDTDMDRLVQEIAATRPQFVLNSLAGAPSDAFLAALARRDPAFTPDRCPVLSCNLTEREPDAMGPAAKSVISAGPCFAGQEGPGVWADLPAGGGLVFVQGGGMARGDDTGAASDPPPGHRAPRRCR